MATVGNAPTNNRVPLAPIATDVNEPSNGCRFPREFPGVHYYGREEEDAAVRVIRARSPFRYYGANFLAEADSLEREFAARLDRKYAQAVASCTSGMAASLAALGVGPGQEVLLPGFFWVATVAATVRAGAVPVLVEIDDTFTMDPDDLQRKITGKSRLILPVHMCGVPSNSPDGFPWTHPDNVVLRRKYQRGALPQTDRLLERSIVLQVPSLLTQEQENDYCGVFRQAYRAAGIM